MFANSLNAGADLHDYSHPNLWPRRPKNINISDSTPGLKGRRRYFWHVILARCAISARMNAAILP